MKKLLLLLTLLVSGLLAYAQGSNQPIAQVTEMYSNGTTTSWDSTAIEYGADSSETMRITFAWDGVGMVPSQKSETSYLPNNTTKEDISQWDGSTWQPYQQIFQQFNGNGDQISLLYLVWNGNQYDTVNRTATTYGTDTDTTIGESWIAPGNWEPTTMDIRVLDAAGNLVHISLFNHNGSSFVLTVQQIFRYNAGVLDTSYYVQGTTDTLSYSVFSYSNGLLTLLEQYQNPSGTGWEPIFKTQFYYNAQDLLISQVGQIWSVGNWVNDDRYETRYDSQGQMITRDFYDWNNTTNLWTKTMQQRNYYKQSVGLMGVADALTAQVWPNPFAAGFQVELPNIDNEMELTLLDMAGQKVLHQNIATHRTQINTGHLPAGVYILVLNNGGEYYRQRVVKGW